MIKILLSISLVVSVVLVFYAVSMYQKYTIAKELVARAQPFEQKLAEDREDAEDIVSVLVLGDSTGVGVGASASEESIAGLFAERVGADVVENYAQSGARTRDVLSQSSSAPRAHYSFILIHTGANDIIRFTPASRTARELNEVLEELSKRGERVFILSAGNVGGATFFPHPVRPLYTRLTQRYHDAFADIAKKHGATYINLFIPPEDDPFTQQPKIYLAKDGLHPSSAGYRLWFEKLEEHIY